jgi:hypothetical protein
VILSSKTEPFSSINAEPLRLAGVVGSVRRARVRGSARWSRRGVRAAGSGGLRRRPGSCWWVVGGPGARRERTGPPPKRASEMPRVSPGWPECSNKAPEGGAARTAGPGPGDWDSRTRRSAARKARKAGRTVRGWAGHPVPLTPWAHGPGRTGAGCHSSACLRRWRSRTACLSCDSCLL